MGKMFFFDRDRPPPARFVPRDPEGAQRVPEGLKCILMNNQLVRSVRTVRAGAACGGEL